MVHYCTYEQRSYCRYRLGLVSILYRRTSVRPSFVGKAAIASQIILVAYVLLELNMPTLPAVGAPAFILVALLTAVSGLQYIYRS
jgi:phosphatidylglycerophosphate synthase